MAYLQGFQPLEQRDEQDLVVSEGVVSKRSPFSTSDNNGIYDVIAENLRYLNESLKAVTTNADIAKIRNEVKKMYNDMLTNENFGSIEATAQAKIAKEQADLVAKRVEEANGLLKKITDEKYTINDDIADAKNTLNVVVEYLDKCDRVQTAINSSLERASQQADSAEKAATEANKAKVWAEYSGSPDNTADKDSKTGKTMSSKGWALEAREDASNAKTSENKAKTSETNAKSSETNASLSEINAKNSESKAKLSETNAKTSETNAKASEDKAEVSYQGTRENVVQAQNYFEKSQMWAEGTPPSTTEEVETEVVEEIPNEDGTTSIERHTVKENQLVIHRSSKQWAEQAKQQADCAKESAAESEGYCDTIKAHATQSNTNAKNAADSEANAKSYMDKAKAYSENCDKVLETSTKNAESTASDVIVTKKWATNEASPDGKEDTDSPSGFTMSSRAWALNAKDSSQSAMKSAENARTYTQQISNALETVNEVESRAKTLKANIEEMQENTLKFLNEARTIRESLYKAVTYQGTVETFADLPVTDIHIGDMYNVKMADKAHDIHAGDNVVWDGTRWDNMGGFIDTTQFATTGSDASFKSVTADTFKGNLTGNASKATTASKAGQLSNAQTVDGVRFDGTSSVTHYGSCATAAGTAAKTVDCAGFALASGARIIVKFSITNTASNPTLNVNGTGAKAIFYRGASIGAGYLTAGRTYEFVFNGTEYEFVGDINTDTNNATAQNVSTTNATYPVLLGALANATANIGNMAALFGKGVKVNPSTSEVIASKFTGNLVGNVTGNVSGSSGSCTGNAATATRATTAGTADTAKACTGNAATATVAESAKACTGNAATATRATTAGTADTAKACSGNSVTATTATNVNPGQQSGMVKGTKPTGTVWTTSWIKCDSKGTNVANRLGEIRSFIEASGRSGYELLAYDFTTNSSASSVLGVYKEMGGAAYACAPTPATADNSTKIATTAFVKAQGYITSAGKAATAGTADTAKACSGNAATATTAAQVNTAAMDGVRMRYGDYGVFFRNDGSNFYLLKTAKGQPMGTFDSTRPLTVNLANGVCSINGNAATATRATTAGTADTAKACSGNAATATTATKATQDGNGNNIVNTYATKTELNNKTVDLSAYAKKADIPDTSQYAKKNAQMDSTYDGLPIGAVVMSFGNTSMNTHYINISNRYTINKSTHSTFWNWLWNHGIQLSGSSVTMDGIGQFNGMTFWMKVK